MESSAGTPPASVPLRYQVRDLPGFCDMTQVVVEEILEAVFRTKSPALADRLRRSGIEHLHEVVGAGDFGPLRDQVLDRLRTRLLAMAVAVGRKVLGWDEDFYINDYLILRINFPYEVARQADPAGENPGAGRLSEPVRATHQARKVIDPIYNPRASHRNHPPAAWAHAPHVDTWAGHSIGGRNIWWAIGDVPASAGMVIYPELAGKTLPLDRRTLGLRSGFPLPKPTYLEMHAGEMLVFDPEVLHGTHLNVSNVTRVAVTMRLNASEPKYSPSCFYAHEFWRRASDIEIGRDEVLHIRREEHLGEATATEPADSPPNALQVIAGAFDPGSGILRASLDQARVHRRVIIEAGTHRVILIRTDHGLRAFDSTCPHYGVDMGNGAADDEQIFCPACAVGFNVNTGESSCPSLALRRHEIWEADGVFNIRIAS